jgi:hypothetical protein
MPTSGGLLMRAKEALSFIFKVVLLGLAILMIIFGLFTDVLNGEKQMISYDSDEGKTMPEEGYFTPVYDPMTYVKVEVASKGGPVEVHMYTSTYRGGNIIKDTENNSVTRDEWLAAGKDTERIGTDVVLKDFSTVSAQYWVRVVEPDGSIPSDVEYKITIRARTYDLNLIAVGLLFYAIFIFMGILENVHAVNLMLKQGVPMKAAEEAAEAADLEALLEPTARAAAPMAPAAPPPMTPGPAAAPTSYEALYGAPMAAPAAPAPEPAPPPAPEPPVYQPPPPAYQPPPPAYQPPPPAPAPAPAPVAPDAPPAYQVPPPPPVAPAYAPAAASEPVSKVRCPSCKSIVPVYTTDRPTPIECPTCGKKGMIR